MEEAVGGALIEDAKVYPGVSFMKFSLFPWHERGNTHDGSRTDKCACDRHDWTSVCYCFYTSLSTLALRQHKSHQLLLVTFCHLKNNCKLIMNSVLFLWQGSWVTAVTDGDAAVMSYLMMSLQGKEVSLVKTCLLPSPLLDSRIRGQRYDESTKCDWIR